MIDIFYYSSGHSVEAALQRFNRILMPILSECMNSNCDKNISIDSKNMLCINGTPIGDWRNVSNFTRDDYNLVFRYGEKIRTVVFGISPFELGDYVSFVWECDSDYKNNHIVYCDDIRYL